MVCVLHNGLFGHQKIINTQLDHIRALGLCRLEVFILKCSFENKEKIRKNVGIGYNSYLYTPTSHKYKSKYINEVIFFIYTKIKYWVVSSRSFLDYI